MNLPGQVWKIDDVSRLIKEKNMKMRDLSEMRIFLKKRKFLKMGEFFKKWEIFQNERFYEIERIFENGRFLENERFWEIVEENRVTRRAGLSLSLRLKIGFGHFDHKFRPFHLMT